jgi:thymidylate synthase (FAD)
MPSVQDTQTGDKDPGTTEERITDQPPVWRDVEWTAFDDESTESANRNQNADSVGEILPEPVMDGEDADPTVIPEKSVTVELVSAPDWEEVRRVLVDSAVAAFGYEPNKFDRLSEEGRDRLVEEIISGGALPNSLEGVKYVFYVKNISKTILAQITRHRIGVSFTSVTSGNFDQRKTPYILPDGVKNAGHEETFVETAEKAYEAYAEMVDDGVPLECARDILPGALRNYHVFTANYRALETIFGIRSVEPQQPVVWKYLLDSIREEIRTVHPVLAEELTYHNSWESYPMDLEWSNYAQFRHPEAPEGSDADKPNNFIYDDDPRRLRE